MTLKIKNPVTFKWQDFKLKTYKYWDLETKENIDFEINGRHDACIVSRVLPVIEAVTSYALYELMMLNLLKRGK